MKPPTVYMVPRLRSQLWLSSPRKPLGQATPDTSKSLSRYLSNRPNDYLPFYHSKTTNTNHTGHL
jgi:hypothetical protein